MKVIIFVRQNIDWANMTAEKFYMQSGKSTANRIIKSGIDILRLWEGLFRVSFFEFRAKMKDIAEKQNSKTGCPIIRGEEEMMEIMEGDEDAYLVPVDDDDFFRCDISKIQDLDNNGIVVWPECWISNESVGRARPANRFVGTNCYAVRKSYLKQKVAEYNQWAFLRYHGAVSRIICHPFAKRPYPHCRKEEFIRKCTWIEECLSVSNRHAGTIGNIQPIVIMKKPFDREMMKKVKKYRKPIKLEKEFEWCKESVENILLAHQKLMGFGKVFL
jgi:hypothetical protein